MAVGLCLFARLIIIFSTAIGWVDPPNDMLPAAPEPAMDLTELNVTLQPEELIISISLNSGVNTPADLLELQGFVDLDTDFDATTGSPSHIDSFWPDEPYPYMGVDYFVTWPVEDETEQIPWPNAAELSRVVDNQVERIGFYTITRSGTTATIVVPRCQTGPEDGVCLSIPFRVAALIGNGSGPTDRGPNDSYAFPYLHGDFDGDYHVDPTDVNHMAICKSGSMVPFLSGCEDADLDSDGDVDQTDFGLLQQNYTGP